MKKIVLLIIIASSAFVGILVFFLFFRSAGTVPPAGSSVTSASDSSNPASGLNRFPIDSQSNTAGSTEEMLVVTTESALRDRFVMKKIINTKTEGATLSADGNRILYYDILDPVLASVNFLGADPRELADLPSNVEEIIWAPDKDKIVYRDDAANITYFEIAGKKERRLNPNIKSVVFTSDSQKICYQYSNDKNSQKTINIATPGLDLTDFKVLVRGLGDYQLRSIPMTTKLAYFLTPSLKRSSIAYSINTSDGNREILVGETLGLDARWSPDGKKMVFTQLVENGRLALLLAPSTGLNPSDLKLYTYVDKTAWHPNGSEVYVAEPQQWVSLEDYYSGNVKTNDILYKVNINTGEKTELLNLFNVVGSKVDFRDGFFTSDGKILFFTNAVDQSVYMIDVEDVNLTAADNIR